jgi:hypothetical protein
MAALRPILLSLACIALIVAAEGERQSVRLLAIGNSFSANILRQLPSLAQAGGRTLEFAHCMFGGARLEQHWARVEASLRDPKDPKQLYAFKLTLRETLAQKPWDVVTIQQYSFISHDASTYRPYADKLVSLIRESAPQATVLMHETWAYRSDDPRFVSVAKDDESEANQAEKTGVASNTPADMRSSADMHRLVAAAYRSVAKDLGVGLIPVGDAFAAVEADPVWGFVADPAWNPKAAIAPALPDQHASLHVGWVWREKDGKLLLDKAGKPALAYDGHHANKAGEYLGACVWYEVLFRASPVGVPYRPEGMSEEQALFLQETAHRVAAAEMAGSR